VVSEALKKYKRYQYYAIIGVISFIAVFFLPFVGSELGLDFKLPNTVAGWVVYVIGKLLVATINILLFHCFVLQAKVNVKDDPNFLKAKELLENIKSDNYIPMSPEERHKNIYTKKGVFLFITSILSAVGLSNMVLNFSLVNFLTYLFTIVLGVIFGVLTMNEEETYWTVDYLKYAQWKVAQKAKEEEALKQAQIELESEIDINVYEQQENATESEFEASTDVSEGEQVCLQSEIQNTEI
jgi:hypothetical protein